MARKTMMMSVELRERMLELRARLRELELQGRALSTAALSADLQGYLSKIHESRLVVEELLYTLDEQGVE